MPDAGRLPNAAGLTAAQRAALDRDGFLAIDDFVGATEVARLGAIFDRLFASDAGRAEGKRVDLAGLDDPAAATRLPQIVEPSDYAPELKGGDFVRRARAIAQRVFGDTLLDGFGEHMIFKPAGAGAETPWHQDMAYHNPAAIERSINFWMPLDDTDEENGCMRYVPGSHRSDVLPHHSIGNDPRIHGLEVDEPGQYQGVSVPVPLRAGGCVLHLPTTLHFAGANMSRRQRRAYILIMNAKPVPRAAPIDNYWMREKRTSYRRAEGQG